MAPSIDEKKDELEVELQAQETRKNVVVDETELWEKMDPSAWCDSIANSESIFHETYVKTRQQILKAAKAGSHDVIIEIGCGTGDIIGRIKTDIDRFGLDINPEFIEFCDERYSSANCKFIVQDVAVAHEWWDKVSDKYKKPLVVCVNNTLNIVPEEIRGTIVAQMLNIVGEEGRCLVSYWNGTFFSHAIMNYYGQNPRLCGHFTMADVNWEKRRLLTPSGYSTEWYHPEEVQKLFRAYDVDVEEQTGEDFAISRDHMNVQGLGIFVWFSDACMSKAKGYYDSEDAQKFYNSIWGKETVHIGRYDLLSNVEEGLPKQEQILRAQELQEARILELVSAKFQGLPQVRILDMGCGYGGLLRRFWEAGKVWSATGLDISAKMCKQARELNEDLGCSKDIAIIEESYLDVSLEDESVDLVLSMDALLHVGPEKQRKAIMEAHRVLRPGGWMVFSDIMQQEGADPEEMQPIYDRIHLSKMGTVSNYKDAMEEAGFSMFDFEDHSSNVSSHYGAIREVLAEKGDTIGLSKEYQTKMEYGLSVWRDLAPRNIVWGLISARKTKKSPLTL